MLYLHMLTPDAKRFFILSKAETSEKFGKAPEKRDLDELRKYGVIILDKPAGPSSHQVDAWIKDILAVEKTGHSGTLDPKVTGVLPIALNEATKALSVLLHFHKEYVCLMHLHRDVPEKKIREVCKEFVGEIYQKPPMRSAVKREIRTRVIDYINILEIDGRRVLFRVGCEAGTYIRTLCVDIGRALGCGASMRELRRTRVAQLTEDDAVTLQEVKDAQVFWQESKNERFLREVIRPAEVLLRGLPQIVVKDSVVEALCNGANLALPGIVAIEKTIQKGDAVALMTLKGEGAAFGHALLTAQEMSEKKEGIAVDIDRVLMEKGTYPKMWRSAKDA